MLMERIDRATSITDLIPMIKHIDLGEIKRILKCKIDSPMSDSQQSEMFFDSVSIEQSLPTDVLQHITSFNKAFEIKAVSKTLNKCYEQNAKHEIKRRKDKSMSIVGKREHSKTWLVHPDRAELSEDERRSLPTFEGPINDLQKAINMAKPGDDILLYGGGYVYEEEHLKIDKPLRFIGIGERGYNQIRCELIDIKANIFCKNFKFNIGDSINVSKGVTAWFHGCNFFLDIQYGRITTGTECDLDFRNCNVDGGPCDAITIGEDPINVNIEGCHFHDVGKNQTGYPVITVSKSMDFKKINLRRNKFSKCISLPIGLDEDGQLLENIKDDVAVVKTLLIFNDNYIEEDDHGQPLKSIKALLIGDCRQAQLI